ncbi:MAG TPA: hypothetical protein VJW23_13575 [Propionibacteriaceae bacterium]|nr:hypothetical protein [Propionibacteriaceae bacterium]
MLETPRDKWNRVRGAKHLRKTLAVWAVNGHLTSTTTKSEGHSGRTPAEGVSLTRGSKNSWLSPDVLD